MQISIRSGSVRDPLTAEDPEERPGAFIVVLEYDACAAHVLCSAFLLHCGGCVPPAEYLLTCVCVCGCVLLVLLIQGCGG